jgi:hypothetical protein
VREDHAEAQLSRTRPYVQQIAQPGWDIERTPAYRRRKPRQKAVISLSFNPRDFPDYDPYVWLGADCRINASVDVYNTLREILTDSLSRGTHRRSNLQPIRHQFESLLHCTGNNVTHESISISPAYIGT